MTLESLSKRSQGRIRSVDLVDIHPLVLSFIPSALRTITVKMAQGTENEDHSSWADASVLIGLPAAVRAAILLDVPKIIDSAYPTLALSAQEICKQVPGYQEHSASPENLEKILDWLCCNGVFSLTMGEGEQGSKVKKYGHSPKSRCLSNDQTTEMVLILTAPEMARVWPHAHQVVLDPSISSFERANGKFFYEYLAEDAADLQRLYVRQLNRTAAQALNLLEEKYDEELKALQGRVVDVGGQEGAICAGLLAKYPHLQFVNFDLPVVVKAAPQIPGVEHVGGSFHDSVPQGNLLFMKFCLLNWDDEACVRILTNCRDALVAGQGGKMLIIDRVDRSSDTSSNQPEEAARTASAWSNFLSTQILSGARTRTVEEFRRLALKAGFSRLEFVHYTPGFDLMEARI